MTIVRMAGEGRPALPAELHDALDRTDGAWERWDEEPPERQQLYAEWVASPRSPDERRERAELTSYYAAHGALDHAVQRPRKRNVLASVLDAIMDAF